MIAATGDDKVNVAAALLAKTEFAVSRVVARVNEARNEPLFDDAWGVDVAVSTPPAMVAATVGTIDAGHLVRLMELKQGHVSLEKLILPDDNPLVGRRVADLALPENSALIVVVRGGQVVLPNPDDVLRTSCYSPRRAGPRTRSRWSCTPEDRSGASLRSAGSVVNCV